MKKLTPIDRFIRKLAKMTREKKRRWRLGRDGRIRSGSTCPIAFVAGESGCFVYNAIRKVGLGEITGRRVCVAADRQRNSPLRRRLLRACGIKQENKS